MNPLTHNDRATPTVVKKTHAILKVGLVALGTQVGTSLIHRLVKQPLVLFGVGVIGGIAIAKNQHELRRCRPKGR